ncbi:MAG: PIN domain-containing protein [Candidatus Hydrogenedens sp.]|nr:PIN domain-containing protein [Candidatus Hydrogenedens sp.]
MATVESGLLVDTDILVDVYRNHGPTVALLSALETTHTIQFDLLSEMELIAGCRNKDELSRSRGFLERFHRIVPSEQSLLRASALLSQHYLSDGLSIPDAIIASTSIELGIPLLTRNLKHFRNIEGVVLFESE